MWAHTWQSYISLQTIYMYWQCTYLGFGLLEAPCEYILHGPLLAMYWLRLCPHSRKGALEATLVWRRLFIALMTAAHISPNDFSLRVFPTSVQWTSYYNTWQRHTFILYITFICTFTSSYYTSHLYVHSHLHFFCSSLQAGCLRLFVSDTRIG
jgi:hypothetical protein